MSEHDDEPRPVDPDRAAILARRQHFIALALSGLATACTGKGKPEPCLEVMVPAEEGREAPPQPCLNVVEVAPADTGDDETDSDEADTGMQIPPEACLKIARPEPDETGETGTETETGGEATPEKAKPKPCLKKAPPQPCLDIAPERPEDD